MTQSIAPRHETRKLLDAITTADVAAQTSVAAGFTNEFQPLGTYSTFQAVGSTSAGVGAATVVVQGSNDGTNWLELGTITLVLGTAETSDGFASSAPWLVVRGFVDTAGITGTDGTVTLYLGA